MEIENRCGPDRMLLHFRHDYNSEIKERKIVENELKGEMQTKKGRGSIRKLTAASQTLTYNAKNVKSNFEAFRKRI